MAEEDNAEEVVAPDEEPEPNTQEESEPETQVELDLDSPDEALLHFGRYSEMRHAVPWQQKTRMEKANYYLDRIFAVFITILLLSVLGQFVYMMWYLSNKQKIMEFVLDLPSLLFTSVSDLVSQLFAQEKDKMVEL